MKKSDDSDKLGRRELFRRGALAGVAAGLLPFTGGRAARAEAQSTVKRYVPLGRTGFEISDISFGSSRLDAGEEHLVLDALERGINYFDTAESYRGGDSEITIGNALRGKRDKVFIASKTHTSATETK